MTKKVTLAQGIIRGEDEIKEITIRKPLTKQLRGTSITRLAEMDAEQWQIVLQRVTIPKLEKTDLARMNVADFVTLCSTASDLMFEDAKDPTETDGEDSEDVKTEAA